MRVLILICMLLLPMVSQGETISEKPIFLLEYHKTHVSSWGDLLTAYYDKDYRLHLKNITQGWSVPINTTDPSGSQPAGIALDTEGNSIYIAWRPKERKKEVYFRASHDRGKTWSNIKKINTEDQALMPLKLKAEADIVAVVWKDERKKGFHVYMNYSVDRGETFLESDIKVSEGYDTVANPFLLLSKGKIMVFFNGMKGNVNYVVLRVSSDRGKTWKEEILAETGSDISYEICPVRIGDRVLVFWCVSWNGIMGAYSDGTKWEKLPFENTKTLDVGSIKAAYTQNGDIYLSFYARKEKDKTRVYLYQSHDHGATWSDMRRIDDTPYDLTRSALQSITADEKGRVVIVWQDYRNIRSNIYMKYSLDFGKTWLTQDIPVEEKGKYNSGYPSVEMSNGRCYIIAWRFKDDRLNEAYLYLFPVQEIGERI